MVQHLPWVARGLLASLVLGAWGFTKVPGEDWQPQFAGRLGKLPWVVIGGETGEDGWG